MLVFIKSRCEKKFIMTIIHFSNLLEFKTCFMIKTSLNSTIHFMCGSKTYAFFDFIIAEQLGKL